MSTGLYTERGFGRDSGTFRLDVSVDTSEATIGDLQEFISFDLSEFADEPIGSEPNALSFDVQGNDNSLCVGYGSHFLDTSLIVGGRFCGHFGKIRGTYQIVSETSNDRLSLSVASDREFSLVFTVASQVTDRFPLYAQGYAGLAAADFTLTTTGVYDGETFTDELSGWGLGSVWGARIAAYPHERLTLFLAYEQYDYGGELTKRWNEQSARLHAEQKVSSLRAGFQWAVQF